MAFKDTFKNIINYFEVDDASEQEEYEVSSEAPKLRVAPTREVETPSSQFSRSHQATSKESVSQPTPRRQEVSSIGDKQTEKTTIDIKFPKKYEDAPEIVNLLLDNASILIDFQYMSETQARRCLDYLDGARSVVAGNLKKVSNTMWLLTPVNVMVNIEELRSSNFNHGQEAQFDFDMKR
ncbi:cell division protein SepF [Streptococcus marmotae]|uniref:cell division protein SepF n=1 Tax=Streptococcus marmotae TaxID=1825069 RepID=UPI00082AE89D|nr:cell division protein SepF [Streptococcus marmotae]